MTRTVGALVWHPLKSGAPIAATEVAVDRWGVRGDRHWMLVEADGDKVSARTDPLLLQVATSYLPDAVRFSAPGRDAVTVAYPQDGEVVIGTVWGADARGRVADDGGWFSELLGRPVRLLWCDDPEFRAVDQTYAQPGDTVAFADGFPLHLATMASLEALQGWVDESCASRGEAAPRLQMPRFRPNVVVDGGVAWEEQQWERVAIGDMVFRAPKLCGRCVMPNIDLHTLEVGKEPLRTLAARNRIGGKSVFGINLVPEAPGILRLGDEVRPL